MHAAEAVEHARAALHEADRMAKVDSPDVVASLVAVADGWTRLAATLAGHPVGATTVVHVQSSESPWERELEAAVRRADARKVCRDA